MKEIAVKRRLIFQTWEMSRKTAADWVKMDDLLDFLEDLEKEYENEHVNP